MVWLWVDYYQNKILSNVGNLIIQSHAYMEVMSVGTIHGLCYNYRIKPSSRINICDILVWAAKKYRFHMHGSPHIFIVQYTNVSVSMFLYDYGIMFLLLYSYQHTWRLHNFLSMILQLLTNMVWSVPIKTFRSCKVLSRYKSITHKWD